MATCDQVENFYLSNADAEAVRGDVIPALQIILSAMYGLPMQVRWLPTPEESLGNQIPLPPLVGGPQIYQGIAAH